MADEITPGEAAKALGKLGASKGGKARAEKLSPERRKEIAQKAIQARWAKTKDGATTADIPKATHTGTLKIGEIELPCAVLEDGTRVFTQGGFLTALGRSERPAGQREENVEQAPPFLVAKNLKPYISKELMESSRPILFRPKLPNSADGGVTGHGGVANGYKVELLPMVCQVYLDAREAGKLMPGKQHGQTRIAERCYILNRGLSIIGIVALVDEATGYQYDRDRRDLGRILERFIAKELVAWEETFPREYYENMFRLKGWTYEPGSSKRPMLLARMTLDLVYKRLAPGVLEELQRRSPKDEKGRRKNALHQWLSEEFGYPKLREHFASLRSLWRLTDNYEVFHSMVDRALPSYNETMMLPFPLDDDTDIHT